VEYGNCEKRRTKKDLKRKRLARGYKRGGKFRTHEVEEVSTSKEIKIEEKGKKKRKKALS
jgi:hypothetical protein